MKEIFNHITKVTRFIVENNLILTSLHYTEDNSIFYIIHDNEMNNHIYIEIFLEDSDDEEETVVNIYNNKKLIFNYGGNMDKSLEAINNLINEKNYS